MGLKQIEDEGLAAKVKTDREHVFRSAVWETTRAWAELGQCELQGHHLLRKKKSVVKSLHCFQRASQDLLVHGSQVRTREEVAETMEHS